MGYKGTVRTMEAAQRRQQREAHRHLRELERQAKAQTKLSAIEQARLEVETFDGALEVLLSVHKEQGQVWDWVEFAAALPPHKPTKLRHHEFKARQHNELIKLLGGDQDGGSSIEEAHVKDDQEFQEASQTYAKDLAEWEKMKTLARRILAGEHSAYTGALVQFSGLTEISDLGSSIHFTIHDPKLVECGLTVNGRQSIPTDQKTLTAAGKLSVKPMPQARFHEIYQDYVCGCVLRVAREIFALLPVEMVLVTASVDMVDSRSGRAKAQPVLSVAIDCAKTRRLVFEHLDPSDTIETLLHRGDAKASRKSGEFEIITPLTPADLPRGEPVESADYRDLNRRVCQMRDAIKAETEQLNPPPKTPAPQPIEQL